MPPASSPSRCPEVHVECPRLAGISGALGRDERRRGAPIDCQGLMKSRTRGPKTMTTAAGTEQSFVSFVRKPESALYGLALRLCGNPADAADLVQDTFERAFRSYHQLPEGANERAWAAAILHNR